MSDLSRLSSLYQERHRPVQFTPARNLQSTSDDPHVPHSTLRGTPTGAEARQFYEELINEPSSSKSESPSTSGGKKGRRVRKASKEEKREICTDPRMVNRLLKSAQNNDLKDVELCLERGVDINCRDEYGWTPLMCAAQTGANQIVRYLLQKGCDCKTKDVSGRNAAGIALLANRITTYELIENGLKPKVKVKPEPEEVYFCDICARNVTGKRQNHEASLAHQLSESNQRENKTIYQLPEHNRGFQMMLRSGWSQESGLGSRGQGQKYPVKTILRKNRACLGHEQPTKARVTHSLDEIHTKTTKVSKPKPKKGKAWEKAMRSYLDL